VSSPPRPRVWCPSTRRRQFVSYGETRVVCISRIAAQNALLRCGPRDARRPAVRNKATPPGRRLDPAAPTHRRAALVIVAASLLLAALAACSDDPSDPGLGDSLSAPGADAAIVEGSPRPPDAETLDAGDAAAPEPIDDEPLAFGWSFEAVGASADLIGTVRRDPSMVIDGKGHAHIAYERLDLDAGGPSLFIATDKGTDAGWRFEAIARAANDDYVPPTLRADSSGRGHVAFEAFGGGLGQAAYAYETASGWSVEAPDVALGTVHLVPGAQAMDLDPAGLPRMLARVTTSTRHELRRDAAGLWGASPITPPQSAGETLDPMSSIAVDPQGRSHVLLSLRQSDGQTRVVHGARASGAWTFTTVDTRIGDDFNTAVAIRGTQVHLVYGARESGRKTYHVVHDSSAGTFGAPEEILGYPAYSLDLALSPAGRVHVAVATRGVAHAFRAKGAWTKSPFLALSNERGVAVAVDAAGKPHLAYVTESGLFHLRYGRPR
jgi:hypothetical protein